ncbi:hypothetical protein OHC33_009112 [Knufia fluminis]|uniref:Xylanolytic transcriptional activator regulatory domain-containing protein n=1 Tax=Knufia fluminis TaxID=191047 RepID=A0AAN8IJ93_9EURO|nr:hypothetical protein OHC33_009112 [Knufia fluminis]
MVETSSQNVSSPPENVFSSNGSGQEGTLDRDAGAGAPYTGSTHWSAILEHIHELKNEIVSGSDERVGEPVDHSEPDALFGSERPPSLAHILKAHLPPRIQVDRRISQYFNARYMIMPLIHSKQFRRQYEAFWQDPLKTNVMWVSIMFSLCCLAASLGVASSQSPDNVAIGINQRESFQTAAGQCLVLGNYSKPQPYVVEALSVYLQCKVIGSLDPQREVALIFGLQTRLAYLMGYHRDGSNFPKQLTPFETEMRRRTWAMVKQFDLLVAFQLGIPNNIPPESWDTRFPTNLLDSDFDEDAKALPPSRPEADVTQILYFVVKARIVDTYSKICHHSVSFPSVPPTTAVIMSLDAQIRAQAETIPESLRIRPVSQSITDPFYEVMVRLNLSFLWQKSLCILHRKYMAAPGNEYSYKTCVDAASSICTSLIDIHPELQEGGAFSSDNWMCSSFTVIDFLLATIILCLAMSVSRRKCTNAGTSPQQWLDLEETKSVLQILEKCQAICVDLQARSREARRVSSVISAVLGKLRITKQGSAGADGVREYHDTPNGTRPGNEQPSGTSTNGISMKPLSLNDAPTSINTSTVPIFYGSDKAFAEASSTGQVNSIPNMHLPTPAPSQPEVNSVGSGGFQHVTPTFRANGAAPQDFSMDVDLGPISDFMNGSDDASTIDWTQLDQFTGWYGHDSGPGIFDMMGTGLTPAVETHDVDYEDWESTPIYMLGARARDPVTGKSQQT